MVLPLGVKTDLSAMVGHMIHIGLYELYELYELYVDYKS